MLANSTCVTEVSEYKVTIGMSVFTSTFLQLCVLIVWECKYILTFTVH